MTDTYMIYCQQGTTTPLVLGVHDSAPTQVIQCAPDSSQGDQIWSLHPLPGTPYIFLKHEASGLYAKFTDTQAGQILLAALDPRDRLFAIQLQSTGSGYVAINNYAANMVCDVEGGSTADGAPVIAYPWHGGANQQWLFGPPSG